MPDSGNHSPELLQPKRNAKAAPYVRPFPPSRKCSVCLASDADTINKMLLGNLVRQDDRRYSMQEVTAWASLQGLKLSKAAVSRHYNLHLLPAQASPSDRPHQSGQGGVDPHIRKAAEVLVQGIFQQVRAEFAGAIANAAEGVRELASPAPRETTAPPAQVAQEAKRPTAPRRASKARPRGKGSRAMPKDVQAAQKLETALNRIQVMPSGMRTPLFNKLAAEYGTDPTTVRRWLRQYEQDGLGGILRVQRSDRGQSRLPADQVRSIMEIIEAWPSLSARKLYALLKQ